MKKTNSITIDGRKISTSQPPYIIAEMSANHNGDVNKAYKLIDIAKRAGADAIKMQSYTPDTITLDATNDDFYIKEGLWKGKYLYELYKEAYTPFEWHKPLFDYGRKKEISIFSSPFDKSAVDLLEDLGAPAYKIASFECIDLPLIKYAASTKKPLIISTGMANLEEISEAVEAAKEVGCNELALLHCVSSYPALPADFNLATITDMLKIFGMPIGLSDHTISNVTSVASVALGASIIEKHFTLDRNGGGPDDSFSLEEPELASLCTDSKEAWLAIGAVDYGLKSSETGNITFRRSLYFVHNLKEGDVISEDDVRSVRPGYGVPPKYLDFVIGSKLACDVEYGQPVTKDKIVNWR